MALVPKSNDPNRNKQRPSEPSRRAQEHVERKRQERGN